MRVLCHRCETLEKHGIKRRDVFYNDGEYCKQCKQEKMNEKKQKILNENLLKTLDEIKQKIGGKK